MLTNRQGAVGQQISEALDLIGRGHSVTIPPMLPPPAMPKQPLPVHIATTPAEREGIYRLRYRIYVDEQRDDHIAHADHAHGMLRSELDEDPQTLLFFIGPADAPLGTLRVRHLMPGALPEDLQSIYSMTLFPDLHTRTVCEVGYLMVVPAMRQTAAMIGLTLGAVEHMIAIHGVEVMFASCAPGLLPTYRRMGLRPYGGQLIAASRGLQIPLIALSGDLAHLRRVDSPWLPALRQLAAAGQLPSRDIQPLLDVIEGSRGVDTDIERITAELDAAAAGSTFLERLPEATRERLSREGFVIGVRAGAEVIEAGLVERDLYVILEGVFEIHLDAQHLRTLSRGDLFGEVAFLRRSGQRSASVRALTHGRLLVVRQRFLDRLRLTHPDEAFAMMAALAGILADRLANRR